MEPDNTVFLVDDDAEVRQSLGRLLASVNLPCRSFGNAKEFLDTYQPAWPGCLVLDVRMPGMSGIELQKHLIAKGVAIPIIIITGHGDIPMAVDALQRGAVSFLEKPVRPQQLLDQIYQALARDVQRRQIDKKQDALSAQIKLLSAREREVLDGVVAGKSTKEIAAVLGLSPKTIDFHRAKIMEKMQADSVASLVRMVLSIGDAKEQPGPPPAGGPEKAES
jgi:two-component system, LuxR family, response regulator FixJ